ncbi:hypothetical protein NBO_483g0002 [Nosema bombycis CQ1]|uniref:Uncharacterized protein n=1 Tax=Nosema bombycis (strain CQ1 / CVCC 102059) TaxID=578461 RepID=R0MH53_NOSB1|nr:hypothetical protein NBO_521g0002 [Nosema bombycis CQ1]EOB12261.1 hypothetical protein NBO_483g0002 [Nosema bombycis CQ1]|eukprot:EOB12123.1 hypothetical protein NBO_521g0002 [Nosema bombycis CQ1]
MNTTKEKLKHQLAIAVSKVEKIDPDITDKYYVKEIYLKMHLETPTRLHKIFEGMVLVSILCGIFYGFLFCPKPI